MIRARQEDYNFGIKQLQKNNCEHRLPTLITRFDSIKVCTKDAFTIQEKEV